MVVVPIVDGRAPVLVGVGQCTATDRTAPTSPLELMTTAAARALAGTGLRPESVGVTNCISWAARDPGRALAAALDLSPGETVSTQVSGTGPVDLLRDACTRIAAGSLRVALLAGGEAVKALQDGRYAGGPEDSAQPSRVLGTDRMPTHPGEEAAGLFQPVQFYPMFENALRAAAGRDVRDHQAWLGELWSRFAEVARTNPYAWITEPPASVTDTEGPNRPVCFPYPKLMTANLGVDQAAAVLVCSAEAAREAGIPYDRWVFVHATAAANDHWHVGERAALHRSPAVNAIGRALFGHTRVDPGELTQLDLYSCFPSAVQIAAAELGIDLTDPAVPPTVTGGLTFAGGPGSNYVMHSLAAMTSRLREEADGVGLCTGVGWFLTKHAAVILSARPPALPFVDLDAQSEVDSQPRRTVAVGETGPATVETYTVTYDYDRQPLAAFVAALLPDGRRAFATSTDRALAKQLLDQDPIGTVITLRPDAAFDG